MKQTEMYQKGGGCQNIHKYWPISGPVSISSLIDPVQDPCKSWDPTRNVVFLFQHISEWCLLVLILRDCLWSLFLWSRHHRAPPPPLNTSRDRRQAMEPGCRSWMGFGNLALHYSFWNERPTERLPEFILIWTDEVTVVFGTFIAIVITLPSAITGDVRILDNLKVFIYSLSSAIRINWFALEINKC